MRKQFHYFYMKVNGAYGTIGGAGKFEIGIAMFIVDIYLLLKNIYVQHIFGFNTPFYNMCGVYFTSGRIPIPFLNWCRYFVF